MRSTIETMKTQNFAHLQFIVILLHSSSNMQVSFINISIIETGVYSKTSVLRNRSAEKESLALLTR